MPPPQWPPKPHDDQDDDGYDQNLVFKESLTYVECRRMSAEQCAVLLLKEAGDKLPMK